MTIEAQLFALLGPLAGGRCYPDTAPDDAAFPLIVYQAFGGRAVEFMDQQAADKENMNLQIVVWAKTRLEANAIIRQARAAIIGSGLQANSLGAAVWITEEVLRLSGARQSFTVWYTP